MIKSPVNTDALVICALPDELDALKEITPGGAGAWEEYRDSAGFPYYWRELPHSQGCSFSIAAAQTSSMGGDATSNVATRLSLELRPTCLAMCGICAGDKNELNLGDVVCADRAYRFDYGKLVAKPTGDAFSHDITTYNLEPRWKQAAENYPKNWSAQLLSIRPVPLEEQVNWFLYSSVKANLTSAQVHKLRGRRQNCPDWERVLERLEKKQLIQPDLQSLTAQGVAIGKRLNSSFPSGYKRQKPPVKVVVGAMGTSSSVREDYELFARLKKAGVRKTIAVEMESCTIGLVAANENIKYHIAAKAVSDYGDPDKDDAFRIFSCRSSATFLLAFLSRHLPPVERKAGFFLTNKQYSDRLEEGGSLYLNAPLLGRELVAEKVKQQQEHNWLTVVTGKGGVGKTRLLLESTSTDIEALTRFVPAGMTFSSEHLKELLPNQNYRVVIDDAHRRTDLENLLSYLRAEKVSSVMALVRPGYEDQVEAQAPQGARIGRLRIGRLHRKHLDQLLLSPPYEIQPESARVAILTLAEGNPQLATLAAIRFKSGVNIVGYSRPELVESFSKTLASWITRSASTARGLLLGTVAAMRGCSEADLETLATASGVSHLELTQAYQDALDEGILQEGYQVAQLKPDVISDGFLAHYLFSDRNLSLRPYSWFYKLFKEKYRTRLLEALSESFAESQNPSSERANVVIDDFTEMYAGDPKEALAYFHRFAIAFPEYSLGFIEKAFGDIKGMPASESKDELLSLLYKGTSRLVYRNLKQAWRPLLKLAEEAFSSGCPKTIKEFRDDQNEFLRNCPVPDNLNDARVAEEVRQFIAVDSRSFWGIGDRTPSRAEVIAVVSREITRITVFYTAPAATNSSTYRVGNYPLPVFQNTTEESVSVGAELYCQSFPLLCQKSQFQQVRWLDTLFLERRNHASSAVGLLVNKIIQEKILPFFDGAWDDLSLAVKAEILKIYAQYRHSAVNKLLTPLLSNYLLVICLDALTMNRDDRGTVDYLGKLAPLVDQLTGVPDPLESLAFWSREIEAQVACGGTFRGDWLMNHLIHSLLQSRPELIEAFFDQLSDQLGVLTYSAELALTRLADQLKKIEIIGRLASSPIDKLRHLAALSLKELKLADCTVVWERLAVDPCSNVGKSLFQSLPRELTKESLSIVDLILNASTDKSLIEEVVGELTLDTSIKYLKVIPATQVDWYERLVLWTADKDLREHQLAQIVQEGQRQRGLLLPWLWARLNALGSGRLERTFHNIPRELRADLAALPRDQTWQDTLEKVAKVCEEETLVENWIVAGAARWILVSLAGETPEFTKMIEYWSHKGPELLDLALDLVKESHRSEHFADRAAILLEADPSPAVEAELIGARRPSSFTNSEEPYYRKAADSFRPWLAHSNFRLRDAGRKAVDYYTLLADRAAEQWDEEHNY